MQHKQGEERDQIFMFCLDSAITPDDFVRVVDAFVDSIDLKSFGFEHVVCQSEGCPPYHPAAPMKLYLYGYRYGIAKHENLNGRAIDRSEFAWALEENTKRVNQNPGYYRKRQQIAEHIYGPLKQQRGFTHANVREKEKVPGEFGLMFIGYNITRCISIFREEKLIRMVREHLSPLVWRFKQAF